MNLRELSHHLGLSQTTVSRALNGFPEVSESTRDRVLAAAEQNNYAPNKAARGLATGRTFTIGHVIATSNQNKMDNPIFGDFVAGVGEVYSENGYKMIVSVVPPNEDEFKVYRDLVAQQIVDAVVVHGPSINDPRIPFLRELGLPFIVHGRTSEVSGQYAWLDVNNRSAFNRATDFLHELGHRRIGLLNGPEHMDFAYRRREGYESALVDQGIAVDGTIMAAGEMTESYGHQKTLEMLALPNPPTAFLTASIVVAFGARRAVHEAGKIIGKDVSIITHDDCLSYLGNNGPLPIFTSTKSSVSDAGRELANMLLNIVRNPNQPPPTRLLEAQFVFGQSTGPISVAAGETD